MRPGVERSTALWNSLEDDPEFVGQLKRCHDLYYEVVEQVLTRKNTEKKSWSDLVAVEMELNSLDLTIGITRKQLRSMIDLKHGKCKVRPISKKFDDQNPDSVVQRVTAQAFEELRNGDWEKAIDTLASKTGLYCVAEATATAILCFVDPLVAYASDEVLESVNGCERVYTKDNIIGTNEKLIEKAETLNALDDSFDWTPDAIGKGLYAYAAMHASTTYTGKQQPVMQDLIDQVHASFTVTATASNETKGAPSNGKESAFKAKGKKRGLGNGDEKEEYSEGQKQKLEKR